MILELLLALVVAQPNASNAVAELTQIEQRLASTWKHCDCAGWSAMIAPDGLRGTRETAPRSPDCAVVGRPFMGRRMGETRDSDFKDG